MITCNGKKMEINEDTVVGYWKTGEPIIAEQLSRWVYDLLKRLSDEK